METTEKELRNKSAGHEIKVPCTQCLGRPHHEVMLSIDKYGEELNGDFQWNEHHQIIKCLGCKTISFRLIKSNSDDYEPNGEGDWQTVIYEELYPSRIEERKGLNAETVYLPANIQRIYNETLKALNGKSPVLAGIGLRALVETICKEKEAKGNNLLLQIDDLIANNVLTPTGGKILHKIRTLGNVAAHEVKPHSENQLELAMDVVEHMLKDVFILPKKVELEFPSA